MLTLTMRLYREFLEAISKIRLRDSLGADFQTFQNELIYINFFRGRAIGFLCVVIFLILTGFDIHYYMSGKWNESAGYSLLFACHLSMFVLAGIMVFAGWRYPPTSSREVTRFHKNIVDTIVFLVLSTMVLTSIADILVSGSLAAYLGSIFALAAMFLFSNIYGLFLFSTNLVLMILLLGIFSSDSILLRIRLVNVLTFTILAFSLSRMLFYYHVKDFTNRNLIRLQQQRLEELSLKDPLTKADNRRSFQEISRVETIRANRHGTPLSILIFDLDRFKLINDTFGHCAGDAVLVECCDIVRRNIREVDTLARWGGEEFLILSPQTDISGMTRLAQKLRKVIEQHRFSNGSPVTASFGVTQYHPGETLDELIQRSDRALYQAKEDGRNRIVVNT